MVGSNEAVTQTIETSPVTIRLRPLSAHFARVDATVDPATVLKLRQETLRHFRAFVQMPGFRRNTVPSEYIEENYRPQMHANILGFLLSHLVLNRIYTELEANKVLVVNVPRIAAMDITPTHHARFVFEVSTLPSPDISEWRQFVFKTPRRKNYKDLDKQVALFIKREQSILRRSKRHEVEENDWVRYRATMLDADDNQFMTECDVVMWTRITTRHIARPMALSFLGGKVGDTFITRDLAPVESLKDHVNNRFRYLITIEEITKGCSLSLEALRNTFKLRNRAGVHRKLIEIFSFRNDVSQRRAIIEEVFHLFFSKHRFQVPKHIVIRKQEDILQSLVDQPDYQVYRTQKDFMFQIEQLAEKQLREEILIDHLALTEGTTVTPRDIHNYLSLLNTERLKEFVYFKPALDALEDPSTPLHPTLLKRIVLREKTLNHIAHTLTR